jgi:hypothetical protein
MSRLPVTVKVIAAMAMTGFLLAVWRPHFMYRNETTGGKP